MAASRGICGVTRRGFLLGTATGLAAGVPATWLASRELPGLLDHLQRGPFTGREVEVSRPEFAMPGQYPGRVIEVRHVDAVRPNHAIDPKVVSLMVDRGMGELTGADPRDLRETWGRFFEKDDVVGIKVNPVGRAAEPGEPGRVAGAVGSISSFPLVVKVVRSLVALGLPPANIIVFERYADEFIRTGYQKLVERELPKGVRWYASSSQYSNEQLDIRGFDREAGDPPPGVSAHVAGYDPDVFTVMGFAAPWQSPRDDRRYRSHLSAIVTRLVNKVITLPVLKDHRSAGVTLALKNLSHGMNNNVARSHLGPTPHGWDPLARQVSGPNQCNTFIPQAVSHVPLRQKATLHILDGLIGVYEGGPGCWNRTWGTWHHKGLLFATDPVAMDHVGWDIIDAKRVRMGWPTVERMGLVQQTTHGQVATYLGALAGAAAPGVATLTMAGHYFDGGRASESFALRQPEHIILAGQRGLGEFDRDKIAYRLVHM